METVNGRKYEVERLETRELTRADLIQRGWDGYSYLLTGKRGAVHIALRNAETGELQIVNCG